MLDFKPVTLADREIFRRHYGKYPQTHSETLFTTLISWSHHTPAYYAKAEGSIVIMQMKDGIPQYTPPIGEKDISVLRETMQLAQKSQSPNALIAITKDAKEWIEKAMPNAKPAPNRDFYDYIYLTKDLAELPGKKYLTQRTHLHKFTRENTYTVEKIKEENIKETAEFVEEWCQQHGCDKSMLLQAEVKALTYCIENYAALGLSGTAIRIGKKIRAISVYEPMNETTAAIHFEKAMTEYPGLYQAIMHETAKTLNTYSYLNRESDMGIPGLRTAKERLHPHHLEEIYFLRKNTTPA